MQIIFYLLMLAAATTVHAQAKTTKLQCDGEFSNFLTGMTGFQDTGGYVEVGNSSVKVVQVLGYEGNYFINRSDESRICFVAPEDKRMQGCLNRFTGNLSFTTQNGPTERIEKAWTGKCTPARPLF